LRNAVQRAYILADEILDFHHVSLDEEHSADLIATTPYPASQGDRRGVVIRIGTSIDLAQRQFALATLVQCAWVEDRAAAMLGISRENLSTLVGEMPLNKSSSPSW
jgi:DNA-binding NtrC family response regulator